MMSRVFHQPYEPFAYAVSEDRARIVLQVQPGVTKDISIHFGDRYEHGGFNFSTTMNFSGFDGTYDYYVADLSIPSRRLKYVFEVEFEVTTLWYGESGLSASAEAAGVFQLAYLAVGDLFTVPEWVGQSVGYQVFPDRFAKGTTSPTRRGLARWNSKPTPSGVFGGDLQGILEHLDYLDDLGVNLLYVTPIFASHSNHKYDTTDYYSIDAQFGTKEDLSKLVKEAHRRGIKVMLDAVFNHSGSQFKPFQDVIDKGMGSKYYDWFFVHGEYVDMQTVNYETFATQIASMPKLNVANPAVEEYLLSVASYWIEECDIDGWRLDVANEVDHVFWRKFRDRVKKAKENALIIGEVWHNSLPWLKGDQFDGVMNYVFRERMLQFFVRQNTSAQTFAESLVKLLHQYPAAATRSMFNLLGSHDTERVLTLAQDMELVKRMFTVQFTYPGIPMVYYGDEVGMFGGADPDCRRGMVWEETKQNQELKRTVQALAALRRQRPAFGSNNFEVVAVTEFALEYRRWSEEAGDVVHVAINNGVEDFSLSCQGTILFTTGPGRVHTQSLVGLSALIWSPDVS
ncbi:MAG: hypothetical protein A2201_06770 [Alicyclobacillus sp. RIFOXYA1_FULL_53_8]|nr:MAG: hypothetical protein A2201_06770 [Alicyclobacillus sp. RIFOXYA1_FULL_53_8]